MTAIPVSAIPAEKLARQMVRRALDNATRPDAQTIADATALTVAEVSAIITAEKTPGPARTSPPVPAGRAPATTDDTWRTLGKDHPDRKIRDLYGRACAAVAALDAAIAEYARTAHLRDKAAKLRAELDQIEAQIGGQHACHCGRTFATGGALAVHRGRTHKADA